MMAQILANQMKNTDPENQETEKNLKEDKYKNPMPCNQRAGKEKHL